MQLLEAVPESPQLVGEPVPQKLGVLVKYRRLLRGPCGVRIDKQLEGLKSEPVGKGLERFGTWEPPTGLDCGKMVDTDPALLRQSLLGQTSLLSYVPKVTDEDFLKMCHLQPSLLVRMVGL